MPLPTITEPFRILAMDIVGPLRKTKRGHKFILTVMDFATRYPEAIPLRRTDAATVAEALCGVFTRLGIPEEILSDQGSNFMSELLRKVLELLQIQTSPYHPLTDGMLERFHRTLKGMMHKTCRERTDWDEYLPYVCFAFRDSVHSSTGFTPFQLLFGRDVRGPMSLLESNLLDRPKEAVQWWNSLKILKQNCTQLGNKQPRMTAQGQNSTLIEKLPTGHLQLEIKSWHRKQRPNGQGHTPSRRRSQM